MNIVATKLPLFEEIVEKFLKNGKENILNQLSNLLEQIDDKLCLKRPKSLKIIKSLRGTDTVDGIKLKTLLKRNSKSLRTYTNTKYYGCSQEGMNSHYYASRFAKLPMKISQQSLEILFKIIEAKQNGSKIRIGFIHEYYTEPLDIIGHMWNLREDKFVLDTRGMKKESKKIFEELKYGW